LITPLKTLLSSKSALLILSLVSYCGYGQEAVVAAGSNASSGTGNVSYSVGQIVYTTNDNPNFSVAQGIQQPFEISTLSIDEHIPAKIQLSAYPNPTVDYLTLDVDSLDTESLQYVLIDISGKLIREEKITTQLTSINFTAIPSTTYLIKVTANGKNIKTFKIIKK
jgi:hypothetical protein